MRISCITPTFNRREFWQRCLRCFLSQDYPDIEWVILDNGTDPIQDLLPDDPRIRYFPVPAPRYNHGELMNLAFSKATGDVCIVWDSDDWYAPDRISKHAAAFEDPNIQVTGTSRLYYYIHGTQEGFRYHNWTIQPWLGAFAVRKKLWDDGLKFKPVKAGADVYFLNSIPQEHWNDLNDLSLMVATIHPDNASKKNLPNMSFIETSWEEIELVSKGSLL